MKELAKVATLLLLLTASRIHNLFGTGTLSDGVAATVASFAGLVAIMLLLCQYSHHHRYELSTSRLLFILFLFTALLDFIYFDFGYLMGSIDAVALLKNITWWPVVSFLAVAIVFRSNSERQARRYFRYMLAGGLIYLAANVLLLGAGIAGTRFDDIYNYSPRNSVLRTLGFSVPLAQYPLSTGLKSISAVSGTLSVILFSMATFHKRTRHRWLLAFLGAFAFGVTISVDARMAILSIPLVVISSNLFLRLKIFSSLKWTPLIVPVAALVLPIAASQVSTIRAAVLLSRDGGATNIASLSGRSDIWDAVLDEYREPRLVHLVGFGAYGQRQSGLGETYADTFTSRQDDVTNKSAHNLGLQLLIDRGYLGVAFFVCLHIILMGHLTRNVSAERFALTNALLFTFAAGTTQVVAYPTQADHYTLYLLILAFSCSPFLSKPSNPTRARKQN